MKRSIFTKLLQLRHKFSKKPWASFETGGPTDEGRIAFTISWNDAFIDVLKKAGYEADTEEEMVQLFYLSTQMIPESVLEEVENDIINPAATPKLTSEATILRR